MEWHVVQNIVRNDHQVTALRQRQGREQLVVELLQVRVRRFQQRGPGLLYVRGTELELRELKLEQSEDVVNACHRRHGNDGEAVRVEHHGQNLIAGSKILDDGRARFEQ